MEKKKIESLIRLAQKQADRAITLGNPPFGSVLTDGKGSVAAKAYNTQNSSSDPTGHAEINLLRKAGKKFHSRYLEGYHIFSNAESCSMCMSAAIKAKIRHFYFGAPYEPSMDPQISAAEVANKSKNKLFLRPNILKESCIRQIKEGRGKLNQKKQKINE